MSSLRIGVDVGGTFTDVVVTDTVTGVEWHHKERSTPQDPAQAILDGTRHLLTAIGRTGAEVSFFGHGTTVITNMILERKGARVALVTTRGFRDILDLGRQARPHVYDYRQRRPTALAARRDRFELSERIGADGNVISALDVGELSTLIEKLATGGYHSVAVCFLHSYQAPSHEKQAVDALRSALGLIFVTASHEVAPEYREFERFATTALNAFVGPRASRYFGDLESGLRNLDITAPLYTVTSNAGLVDSDTARQVPVRTALSGPAAAVGGIGRILARHGLGDLVTFDVGGTSTDIAILPGGQGRTARARSVAGHPVLAPMVDIEVIGAGGGSVARLDPGGALIVGPESAGADPGPAAYGRGGQDATVTDAALVIGWIGDGSGLGGNMSLDRAASQAAVARSVGTPLSLSAEQAAQGIIKIATAGMARTIRTAALSRGVEPERLCLVAYGGAGPLLGASVATALGIRRMVVPNAPGTLCARAVLVSDIARDFSETRLTPLENSPLHSFIAAFENMRRQGSDWLAGEGLAEDAQHFDCTIECRYTGQNFEIAVPFDPKSDDVHSIRTKFDEAHAQSQGFSLPARAVEAVTFRLKARSNSVYTGDTRRRQKTQHESICDRRSVHFDGHDWPAQVWQRAVLPGASPVLGPAVIEEATSTTIVPPGWMCHVLNDGTLELTRDESIPSLEEARP
ncbi:hydantoinase/oxoprolinase family protein [Roseobacter sp.]|uniref:hydantoinase/oxoprolinase family protein n=1 Tax=Roseobacter sp. TaxID=1907202 RepID=UPI00385FF2A0